MNATIRRIALSAPVAVALVGLTVSFAQAAPFQPEASDSVQIQPESEKPDIVVVPEWEIDPDFDPEFEGPDDLSDTPEDPVVDPAPEPADSDDDADDNADDSPSNAGKGGAGSSSKPATPEADETDGPAVDETEQTEAVDVTEVAETDAQFPTGVLALIIGGLLLGLAAWASFRAGNKTA